MPKKKKGGSLSKSTPAPKRQRIYRENESEEQTQQRLQNIREREAKKYEENEEVQQKRVEKQNLGEERRKRILAETSQENMLYIH